MPDIDAFRRRRRAAGAGRRVPRRPRRKCGTNFDRSSGSNGTYTFTMKPNIQVNLREEAVVQARETIERRVNELGVTEPSIAQQGANGDRDPGPAAGRHRRRSRQGDHPVDRAARTEDRRAGARRDARGAARQRAGAGGHGNRSGRRAGRPAMRRTPCSTWCGRSRRSPARICGTPGRRSTRTISRRSASR